MRTEAASSKPFPQVANWDRAFAEMATPALLVDAHGNAVAANAQASAMLGCTRSPDMPLDALLATCGARGVVTPASREQAPAVSQIALNDARIVNVHATRLSDGGQVLTLDDISAFVQEAELARSDVLTGLANRATFHARLRQLLHSNGPCAVFCIDLDRFKAINDTLGHPMGDILLRKVADRLRGAVREEDVVARLGGDEFAIATASLSPEEAQLLAARLVDLVGRTYVADGQMLNIGASVGIALAPGDGTDVDTLVKNADLALYRAKAEGKATFRFFEPSMDARMRERRAMEIDLRRALAFRELELFYQPQVNLSRNEVVGFEALLRWNHPTRGRVSPADFIPLAEEVGLIVPIGAWVLRTACKQAATWPESVSVAVNLSANQFRAPGLAETVMAALAHSGLDPARLELEITEGALLEDTETVVAILTSLRSLGVRVSMDDFGTGYSSLSYLQKFPFDKIKIDQSFVRDILTNSECTAIVRAVASLGASLGMKTTAEGVETQQQLDAIRAEGCSEVQGYFTGRPLSAEAAADLLNPGNNQGTEL